MRMRKKKNGAARIDACRDLLIENISALSEDPQFAFSVKRPLYIEIGCGKGNFACGMSAKNPDCNFIAMERVADVACLALEKAKACAEERPDNLRFLIGDAKNLTDWFPAHSADGIYLNFSDPWPKAGHAKRRLTHRGFLELYRRVLKPDGKLYLKTDNQGLFEFSLEEFAAAGLVTEWLTRDLHHSDRAEGNVMTEYEANFSSKGMPIYSATVRFIEDKTKETTGIAMGELMLRQRSYRSFDESVHISREELVTFVDHARLAPSSMNIQPLKYKLCTEKDACDILLENTKWAAALRDMTIPPEGHAPTAYVVICVDTAVSDKDMFARDVGIAAEIIMLSATEKGYGGCMVGNFSAKKLAEALDLPEHIVPKLVLGLGKPDETVTLVGVGENGTSYFRDADGHHFVPKRSLDEIIL